MATQPNLEQLREKYISLTRSFFQQIEIGRSPEDLHQLQEEIEQLLLQLDNAESQEDQEKTNDN